MSTLLMDEKTFDRTLTRLAHEIIERNGGAEDVVLVGIRSRGVPLAQRLSALINSVEGITPPVGELDITFYRDDLSKITPQPTLNATNVPFDIVGKTVVMVDDVLFTGRTARAVRPVNSTSSTITTVLPTMSKGTLVAFSVGWGVILLRSSR